jgi:hypothetical protein
LTRVVLSLAVVLPTASLAAAEPRNDLEAPVDIVAFDNAVGRVAVALPGSVEIRVVEEGDTVTTAAGSCPELTVRQVGRQAVRIRCTGPLADNTVWLRRDADGTTRLVVWSADAPVVEPSAPAETPPEAEQP